LPLTTAVDTALSLRGVPYRLGGTRPETGFDCSGFVRYVFEPVLTLPRTVAEQSRVGRPVRAEDLVAGDLVFFSTIGPGPSHVGIALDGRTFVHAPVSGGVVRVDRLDAPYWRTRYLGARRLG
jgi:cell wall-associated NlpC family hydrolase